MKLSATNGAVKRHYLMSDELYCELSVQAVFLRLGFMNFTKS